MTNIFESDTLISSTEGKLYMDLFCGYGQPSTTIVYFKKSRGNTIEINAFDNNKVNLELGDLENLRFGTLEVHTKIHDVRDNQEEKEDISLEIKVYDSENNQVETNFSKKTIGRGAVFYSNFSVTVV